MQPCAILSARNRTVLYRAGSLYQELMQPRAMYIECQEQNCAIPGGFTLTGINAAPCYVYWVPGTELCQPGGFTLTGINAAPCYIECEEQNCAIPGGFTLTGINAAPCYIECQAQHYASHCNRNYSSPRFIECQAQQALVICTWRISTYQELMQPLDILDDRHRIVLLCLSYRNYWNSVQYAQSSYLMRPGVWKLV
jgi:hypothetical protein